LKLLIAVVQHEDAAKAMHELVQSGFRVTELPSAGGLLGHRNSTLLCGLEDGEIDRAVEVLSQVCRRRSVELQRGHPMFTLYNKVTVGGAVVFVVDMDRMVRIG